ncbi:MAG: GNAT family N-acetyltransferase [Clostridiales bacterium]|jgi:ribosomal protein S18 acetylase RimI-like enzyme|nr:GNAT family N-acetyltransferase [Clostridiales bacterium]
MTQVVKQNDEIVRYLQKDRRVNLNALSYLAYDGDADVYVYDGDVENGVIVGARRRNFFYLATHNKDFLEDFWEFLPAGHKIFSGVPKAIADIMTRNREPVWQSPCKVFMHDGAHVYKHFSDFGIEPLTTADAEEVNEYYTYKSNGSIRRIRESIENMDSACIRIDGRPVAWCLIHAEDGSLGPLYTKSEFRGRGLAEAVLANLMKRLAAKNLPIYVQIADDNAASLALIKKLGGMDFSHDCMWFGLDKL